MERSYLRDEGETPQAYRDRVLETWRQYVGPISGTRYVGGRRVALNLQIVTEMAANLDLLAALGGIPKRKKPEPENCWYSRRFDITKRDTWPTQAEAEEVDIPGFDPMFPQEGFLAVQWWGFYDGEDAPARWGEWQRVGKSPETWDWMWPDPRRFYQFLLALKNNWRNYDAKLLRVRWCPYPAGIDQAEVMHGAENCAIALLQARYPSKAKALGKVRLTEQGGFGIEQMHESAKALKLNVQLRDRRDGIMLETRRADGEWLYNGRTRHGKLIPPVVIYDYDGHALGKIPERPKVVEDDVVAVAAVGSYHDIRQHYGPGSIVWPVAEGYVIERDTGEVIALRDAAVYEGVQKRADELGVANVAQTATPFGVEVAAWRDMNRFSPTPPPLASVWKAANFFPRPYCATEREAGPTADINSAYESCPTVGAKDLFSRYGFPAAEGQVVVKDPPMEVLKETGLVVAVLSLQDCHPWIRYLVAEPRGVYTTMRLQVWLEAGAVKIERLEMAIIAVRYHPGLARPDHARYGPREGARWEVSEEYPSVDPAAYPKYFQTKHWGREAIGRLIPNGDKHQDLFYIEDDAEAASVIQSLRVDRSLVSFAYERPRPRVGHHAKGKEAERDFMEEVEAILAELSAPVVPEEPVEETEGLWRIGYSNPNLPKTSCFHAHAFWLDYTAAVVDREVFRHPWDAIVRVATDSITLAPGHEFSPEVVFGTAPGQWKAEKYKPHEWATPPARVVPDLSDVESRAGAYWAPICHSQTVLHVLEAPAGYGKTTACHNGLKGHRFVSLTPTRKMRKKYAAEGISALTWRWALRPHETFKPDAVRVTPGTILHIAEIGLWPKADVEVIIPWLLEHGYRVVADGHRHQQGPVMGEEPWPWLDYNPLVEIEQYQSRDYRSKEETLAALKLRMMARTNAVALVQLKLAVGATSYNDFLAQWHPRDYVYATLHALKDNTLHAAMKDIHRLKYPDEMVRVIYGEKDRKRSGEEEFIPLGAPIPENAALAYVTTYSSCQGETASAEGGRHPRVWLVEAGASDFFKNAVYTAAGRAEYTSQLGVVVGAPILRYGLEEVYRR